MQACAQRKYSSAAFKECWTPFAFCFRWIKLLLSSLILNQAAAKYLKLLPTEQKKKEGRRQPFTKWNTGSCCCCCAVVTPWILQFNLEGSSRRQIHALLCSYLQQTVCLSVAPPPHTHPSLNALCESEQTAAPALLFLFCQTKNILHCNSSLGGKQQNLNRASREFVSPPGKHNEREAEPDSWPWLKAVKQRHGGRAKVGITRTDEIPAFQNVNAAVCGKQNKTKQMKTDLLKTDVQLSQDVSEQPDIRHQSKDTATVLHLQPCKAESNHPSETLSPS